jgi:Transposase DDE domain group 1
MPVHVYHVESGKPAVVILRTGKTPAGREERTVIKHVTRRIRRHWPKTRICWRAITAVSRRWHGARRTVATTIFGFQGNSALGARVADAAETMLLRHAASESDKVRACVNFEHRPKSWKQKRRFITPSRSRSRRPSRATSHSRPTSATASPRSRAMPTICSRRSIAPAARPENLIKLHKAQLASDRTYCHSATAN